MDAGGQSITISQYRCGHWAKAKTNPGSVQSVHAAALAVPNEATAATTMHGLPALLAAALHEYHAAPRRQRMKWTEAEDAALLLWHLRNSNPSDARKVSPCTCLIWQVHLCIPMRAR